MGCDQELFVAARAGNRAFEDPANCPAGLAGNPCFDARANLDMKFCVADHPSFANLALANLELRLDQRDKVDLSRRRPR